MSGKTSLPLIVEIAFGAGPMDTGTLTWTDVSSWVQRSRSISASRGFDPETQEPIAGRGSLRLRNKDGRFTPGTTGPFGLVRNRLPIRIRVDYETLASELLNSPIDLNEPAALNESTSEVLWTGLIDKLTMGYEDGVLPIVDATLVDRWARLKARKLTGDRLQQIHQQMGVQNLWTLTDPPGASRAEDMAGGLDLIPTGSAPLWSTAGNPQTGAAQVVELPGGCFLTSPQGDSMTGATLSLWAKPLDLSTSAVQVTLGIPALGGLYFGVSQLSVDVAFGDLAGLPAVIALPASTDWRHIAATISQSGTTATLRVYADGAEVYSRSDTITWSAARRLRLRPASSGAAHASYVGLWGAALTPTQIGNLHAAGKDALGVGGQTVDQRAASAVALWQQTTLATEGTFAATMSKQALDGVSQADLLRGCAQAEDGNLFIGRDGWPVLQSRGYRADVALAATIPVQVLSKEAQWELDDQQIWNSVQVDRMALNETVTTINRRDEASIATYDEVSRSFQLWLDTDAAAVDRANQEAIMWSEALPRSRNFAVDLMTCQETIPAATLLAVDVGSRIQISGLPSTAPPQTSSGWYVDAIEDTITQASWVRTFTVSPAIDFLILDDATFGGLDEFPLG